jgi:N-acetyl sugar amidotransferase
MDTIEIQKQETLEVKYGLPRNVTFCNRCVISNQRPNSAVEFKHTIDSKKETIHLDKDGVCDACRVAEEKKKINWQDREGALWELCDRFRGDGTYYDCLVPGSGGKDSFYAAHMLKHKFKMSPLTVTWAPHIYTPWGWNNFQAWIRAGFDNYLMTPNGRVHRLLTRLAVQNIYHPFQPFILGQKNLAPRISKLFNIPLVFFGEDEAEYGNPIADTKTSLRDKSFFTHSHIGDLFLGGESVERLKKDFGLHHYELEPYLPLPPDSLEKSNIEVHYLGYYLKWHPQSCYYYAVEHGGFQASPERTAGTYSKYDSIDDKIDDFHYYTTFIKFGIGRATYDASQEIRSGDITRDEGVALVKKYDGEFPQRFADEIFQYLSIPEKEFPEAHKQFKQPMMTREYFDELGDTFRSPHLWDKQNGIWRLRSTVY